MTSVPEPLETARKFSIAPMMGCTDRHARFFLRLISKKCLLYTEMVTSAAIIHGDHAKLLDFSPEEHPIACQLGGSDPQELAEAARIVEQWGYDEINLNIGCPSDRVQNGNFGACLMADPPLVARCVGAMKAAVSLPVTVKCRIGIDAQDSYENFAHFIRTVHAGGCDVFIIHARKAILQGLSPHDNRTIPPLKYAYAYRLKAAMPQLRVILNGGIDRYDQCHEHLTHLDGVMIGRAAYHNPYWLATADQQIFGSGDATSKTRHQIVTEFLPYIAAYCEAGGRLNHLTRHIIGLYNGVAGARKWRRYLSENAHHPKAGCAVIQQAQTLLPADTPIIREKTA